MLNFKNCCTLQIERKTSIDDPSYFLKIKKVKKEDILTEIKVIYLVFSTERGHFGGRLMKEMNKVLINAYVETYDNIFPKVLMK